MGERLSGALFVAAGGALGALLRYGVVTLVTRAAGASFPLGTLAVNVVGSVAAGALAGVLAAREGTDSLRLFWVVGVLGGFTTFSAFSVDTLNLLREERFLAAAGYVATSVAATLGAAALGFRLAR